MKRKKHGGRDFQPGQSGNPGGRPKLPSDIREAAAMNRVECKRILNRLIHMTKGELIDHLRRDDASMFELLIGSLINKGMLDGDYQRVNFLLDRLIGKVKDDVEVTYLRRVVRKLDGTEVVYTNEPKSEDESEDQDRES